MNDRSVNDQPASDDTAPDPHRRFRHRGRRGDPVEDTLREVQLLQVDLRNARSSGNADRFNECRLRLRRTLRDHPTAWRLTGDLAA
ncbi:MAG: hypothetical protein ACR2GR_03165 [Rhodothermales bacterium]